MGKWILGLLTIPVLFFPHLTLATDTNLACGPRVVVSYTDSSPDFFVIENLSAAGWTLTMMTVDLRGSTGKVIFDTDEDGPGVNASSSFFSAPSGPVRLLGVTPIKDGERALALSFESFAPKRKFSFFIDLDTQIPNAIFGQAYVADSEMAGSSIVATLRSPTGRPVKLSAIFNTDSVADTGAGGCV